MAGGLNVDLSVPVNVALYGVPDPERHYWRTGRKVGRTIYVVRDRQKPSDDDPLIGVMDTPELAAEAVRAHNLDIDIRASR